ncbi:MAG: cell division protein FtsH [Bdellovibrionales bacterium GWA2_49_15]|nr:MAG: cell division protein FtsH [Bdellovibrionales bacterium GWA2_49_15]HAZ13602.1 cell division protein FtsH [Bdellovibrionales bacterium]
MPTETRPPRGFGGNFIIIFLVVTAIFYLYEYFNARKYVETLPYSQFIANVNEGKVKEVIISDTKITGEFTDSKENKAHFFLTVPVKDEHLIETLQAKNVTFQGEVASSFWGNILSWIFLIYILSLLWSLFSHKMPSGMQGIFSMTKSKAKVFVEKDIKTTFNDVAGIEDAKDELKEIVQFLSNPKQFTRLGGRAPKGVLLVGPPGTGKTLLARALAGEAKVLFFSINGSEFVELYVGLGAARVRDLFEQARKAAPCILFIDEIDALGKSRMGHIGLGANDEKEQTLNQLLAEMDGFDASTGVIILAATNRPEVLDPALVRSGRFDRQILLHNPDQIGREQILKVHIQKIKASPTLDLQKVASITSGFSGADLANLVNEAAIVATRRGSKEVEEQDFSLAMERIVAGPEQKKKCMNADEKKRIAYHELGHATVSLSLKTQDKVHKVSIIPRGMGALGYTIQRPMEDRYLAIQDDILKKICVLLGGRASEKIYFNNISTGAADDLSKATNIARAMVTQYGMSEKVGLAIFDEQPAPMLNTPYQQYVTRPKSEMTSQFIDQEVRAILDHCFKQAEHVLELNKNFINEEVVLLLKSETLNESEIANAWKKYGV